jgi:hypothetical protein
MYTVLKAKPPSAEGVVTTQSPARLADGNAMGYDSLSAATGKAMDMARAYPGYCYQVFELVLVGSAETPTPIWTPAKEEVTT